MKILRTFSVGLGLALTIAAGAARAGPPFRTDDPEPVELHHWEVYGFTQMVRTQDGWGGAQPGLEVNYGAAPNLQLHMVAPVTADHPISRSTTFGMGDLELGAKYRFIEEDKDGWRPQVGVFPLVELPTGDENHGLGTGTTRVFLPVWVQKRRGDWLTYGGGGYWINPGAGNQNYWFAGWLLQRQVAEPLALGAEVFYQTADTVGGKDSTGFTLGGVYDFNERFHLLFSAGRGLSNIAATNQRSYYAALQWTF